jgi:hypothetical protein
MEMMIAFLTRIKSIVRLAAHRQRQPMLQGGRFFRLAIAHGTTASRTTAQQCATSGGLGVRPRLIPGTLDLTCVVLLVLALKPLAVLAEDAQGTATVEQLMRAVSDLQAQNEALAARLAAIESDRAAADAAPEDSTAALGSNTTSAERPAASAVASVSGEAAVEAATITSLEQRIRELELANNTQGEALLELREEKSALERRLINIEATRRYAGPAFAVSPFASAPTTVATDPASAMPSAEAGGTTTVAADTSASAALPVPSSPVPSSSSARATRSSPVSVPMRIEPRPPGTGTEPTAADDKLERDRLEQRVRELELAQAAQEDATRVIIQDAMTSVGSNINAFVALGGALEVTAGWTQDFAGTSEGVLTLNTADLDLEIAANQWTRGILTLSYNDGAGQNIRTLDGLDIQPDRLSVDKAFITIGDSLKFPLFLNAGLLYLPFGISTGNPVADVLTIEDPLSVEAFDQQQTAVGIGAAFPTPKPTPITPPVVVPRVRGAFVNPGFDRLTARLGYEEPPRPAGQPPTATLPPMLPKFNIGLYTFNGETYDVRQRGWNPKDYYSATIGYRTRGHCGKRYDELLDSLRCPWSFDVDVDYISSVFDSSYLREAYKPFLGEIGYVPGMAASIKGTLGPFSIVTEWTGAIGAATFVDGSGTTRRIVPSAWQASLGYQFDWHPWITEIGAQGSYLALGYSQSQGLAGVTRLLNDEPQRFGNLPERRLIIGLGEWFLDNTKLALEYSREWDYPRSQGGTGQTANAVFTSLTYVW